MAAKTSRKKQKRGPVSARCLRIAEEHRRLLATNVRLLRESNGWSQQHLADLCGWHRTTIVRIETARHIPPWDQIAWLADVLKVKMSTLCMDLQELYSAWVHETLTDTLRRLRVQKNMSQQEAGDVCGISRWVYADIESGTIQATPEQMAALALAFGQPVVFQDSQK